MIIKNNTKPADFNFKPSVFIRNRHLQSILASSRLRTMGKDTPLAHSLEIIITTSSGSRLLSFLTPQANSKGLIILMHGWEGSSSSAYILDAGIYFFNLGFSICRLNLRDHGDSHHLNEDLFHGALIEETFEAISQLAAMAGNSPVYIIGFSLGANFALRIGRKHSQNPIKGLRHIFAISPPLDPYKTTLAIDNGLFFYRKYFLLKWKRSLLNKQRLFPHKYDFGRLLQAKTCMDLTEAMMPFFPDFPSHRDYFNLYTLDNEFFQNFNLPVNIFIAEDDPVIPLEDFEKLQENKYVQISRQKFGGHCGFLDLFPFSCWHQEEIAVIINRNI
ncbi:MAG: hydrolase [Deltaproteobacteria bacterium HGW-Deltaproteobacteria-10]|nr:MAG: hydrolase [Deltaproteobacteria bacterium HGW-Deltaproteobacteria-10]